MAAVEYATHIIMTVYKVLGLLIPDLSYGLPSVLMCGITLH